MTRFHAWVGRSIDAQYAMFSEQPTGGVGHYVVTTTDLTRAIRANTPAELMRQLGAQYRRFEPVLVQIETEVLSQDKWPSEAEVWGEGYAA